jgi:hypothetical protein
MSGSGFNVVTILGAASNINATSTVTGDLVRPLRPIGTPTINATSTVSGATGKNRGIVPANIFAQTTVTCAITRSFYVPASINNWPTLYLNADRYGLQSRSVRIASVAAPSTATFDANGYVKTMGSKATPVSITFNRSGIALTGAVLGDFPGYTANDHPTIGGDAINGFFINHLDIIGSFIPTGASQQLTAPFTPGNSTLSLVSTTYPSGGNFRVRIGSPGGTAASFGSSAGPNGLTCSAHYPGTVGNGLQMAIVIGGSSITASKSGSLWTITAPATSTRGNVADFINTQYGAGQIGLDFFVSAASRATTIVAMSAQTCAGGINPGYEELICTGKATGLLNLDATSSAGASKSYPTGSWVMWDVPYKLRNCRICNPAVGPSTNGATDAFDDSARATIRGDQDLNTLTGIGAGHATTSLGGSNRDITWQTCPGSTNGRTKVSITYVKALPAGTGSLTAKSVSLQTDYLVHTNVGDGGFEKSIAYTAVANTATTVASLSGDSATVQLRTDASNNILATAEEVRAACVTSLSASIGTYYKPGTVGTEIMHAFSRKQLINGRIVVILATTSGTITTTGAQVVTVVNTTVARTGDFVFGTSTGTGAGTVTEMAELVLSTGASGGTLLVNDVNGDLAANRFPVATPSVPLCAYAGSLGSFQYEGYAVDAPGGGPRFTGVSPLIENNPQGGVGLSQPAYDTQIIKPLFPYESVWPASIQAFASTQGFADVQNLWIRYSSAEPSAGWNSDSVNGVRSNYQYFFNEGYTQDGNKWGASGGNTGISIQNGTVLLHPAAVLGHHAPVHTDNFQVNYCDKTNISWVYVPNGHNSVIFSNMPGANDYPGSITQDFQFDHCLISSAKQGYIAPANGILFSGGYTSTAPATTRTGATFSWFDEASFGTPGVTGSTLPLNFANNYSQPVNVENRWIQDSSLIPGSIAAGHIVGNIFATTTMNAGLTRSTANIITTQISATSTVTGNVTGTRTVVPTTISATSTVSGSVGAARNIIPATISATSTVSGSIAKIFPLPSVSISATSTVSGSLVALRAVVGANIAATSSVAGSVSITRAVLPLTNILATSTVQGAVSTAPTEFIGGAFINATTVMSGDIVAGRGIRSANVAATSTVSGALAAIRQIAPGNVFATSTVSGKVTKVETIYIANISAPSFVSGSVVAGRAIFPDNIFATSTVSGTSVALRMIDPEDGVAATSIVMGDINGKWAIKPDTVISATSVVTGDILALPTVFDAHIFATSTVTGNFSKIKAYYPPYTKLSIAYIYKIETTAIIEPESNLNV